MLSTKKIAGLSIFTVMAMTAIWTYFLLKLDFNYEFESFFPVGDPDLTYYEEFRDQFENDNDYLLIGIIHQPSVFDSLFLSRVRILGDSMRKHPLVREVISPLEFKQPIIGGGSFFEIPILHPEAPDRYAADSLRIFNNQQLIGSAFSKDGTALNIVLKHQQNLNKAEADLLVSDLEALLTSLGLEQTHIAGKARAQGIYIYKMQRELMIFLSISIVLVTLFLILTYRWIWGVLIPLAVVLIGVIWILGIMGASGKSLDILMVLLPTIMFVVGMSDVVHIMTKYIEELRLGRNKIKALRTTVKEVGIATFLTSLTTSIGFLTLLTASIKPIKEFGLFTGIGVFAAFLVAFGLLPALLIFLPKPRVVQFGTNRRKWRNFLGVCFLWALKKRKAILIGTVVLTIICAAGIKLIRIDSLLIEGVPDNDPLRQDFLFFDREFGGSRPFEIAVIPKEGHQLYDLEVLQQMEQVEEKLSELLEIGPIISPVTLIKGLNQAQNGGNIAHFKLPDNQSFYDGMQRYLPRIKREGARALVHTEDQKVGRISTRVGDIGSMITMEKIDELDTYILNHVGHDLATFRITGTTLLIDKNNEYLARNMLYGLAIAFSVVALIAGLMFLSFRMIFITLIPNIIPLLMLAGIMGFFDITLQLTTSIIFTIAFGIAVDDTIHFISKFRLEIQKGKALLYALKTTYLSTGKAITITTAILSGGFLTLVLSDFGGTFYTGLLVSLTLLFALIIDLTLLPVLILLYYKKRL